MKYPDFIIIGAMKCGTTALWRNFNLHPDVHMGKNPDDPKKTSTEIRFWNNGGPHHLRTRGVDWYKSLFQGECSGEKCANYVESPKAVAAMYKHMPALRLIYCIRQPTDRVLSEFWMHHFKPEKIAKFAKFAKESGPRARSRYIEQLRRSVLPHYPHDQVRVVIQERMAADTNAEMNKLYDWLGLPPFDLPVQTVGFDERDAPVNAFRVWRTSHKVDMDPGIRQELDEHFRPFNEALFEWMGCDVPEWTNNHK